MILEYKNAFYTKYLLYLPREEWLCQLHMTTVIGYSILFSFVLIVKLENVSAIKETYNWDEDEPNREVFELKYFMITNRNKTKE